MFVASYYWCHILADRVEGSLPVDLKLGLAEPRNLHHHVECLQQKMLFMKIIWPWMKIEYLVCWVFCSMQRDVMPCTDQISVVTSLKKEVRLCSIHIFEEDWFRFLSRALKKTSIGTHLSEVNWYICSYLSEVERKGRSKLLTPLFSHILCIEKFCQNLRNTKTLW